MSFKKHNRLYDLVVLGATGYTGQLTAEYIAKSLPTNLKWAVAGRSETKLQAVVNECSKLNPDRSPPAIEVVNVNDDKELDVLVKTTFILITAVGPYCLYGEPVVKACAAHGTHYLDITGEFTWVYSMIQKYEKVAKASGAIVIPQIGFDSAPSDLCTWALAGCLREQLGAKTRDVTFSLHKLHAAPSGGTLASALAVFDHFSLHEFKEAGKAFAFSPVPHPAEPKRTPMSIWQMIFGVHNVRNLGMVTTSVMGSVDRSEVERSWGLLSQIPSRKDEFYGPNFRWVGVHKVRNWLHGVAMHWVLIFATTLLALAPPARTLAKKFVIPPGSGAPREAMERDEVEYRAIANPDTDVPSDKQAYCRAWFHGSMYLVTAMFASEAALTILEDDPDLDGGFYTPCCLGQGYVDRVNNGGFKIEVKIQDK